MFGYPHVVVLYDGVLDRILESERLNIGFYEGGSSSSSFSSCNCRASTDLVCREEQSGQKCSVPYS